MALGVLELIAGIFKPMVELIDDVHTSTEEKLHQKAVILDVQAQAMQQVFKHEEEMLNSRAKIVNSEAKSEHWVTSTWRPITMLVMLSLVVGDSMGLLYAPLSDEAWLILQLGIGGYIGSRTVEKGIKTFKSN